MNVAEIQAKIQRYNLLKKDPSFAIYEFILTEKFEKAVKEIEKKAGEEMEMLKTNLERLAEQEIKQRIHKGENGYTPIKGKDYLTKAEIDDFVKTITYSFPKDGRTPVAGVDYPKPKDGRTPIKGIDYFTEKDVEDIVNNIIKELPKQKEKKIFSKQ